MFVYDDFVVALTATDAYYYTLTDDTITYVGNKISQFSNNRGNPSQAATAVYSWNDSTYVLFAVHDQVAHTIRVFKVHKSTLDTSQVTSISCGTYGTPVQFALYDTSILVGYNYRVSSSSYSPQSGYVKRIAVSGTEITLPFQNMAIGFLSGLASFTIANNKVYASANYQATDGGETTYTFQNVDLTNNQFVSSSSTADAIDYLFAIDNIMYNTSGSYIVFPNGVRASNNVPCTLVTSLGASAAYLTVVGAVTAYIVLSNIALLMNEKWLMKVYVGQPLNLVGM